MSSSTSQLSQDAIAFLSTLFAGGASLLTVLLAIFSIVFTFAIIIATYLLVALPEYQLAKNAGYDKPWMAFIPLASTYLMFILPIKEFNIFNWIKLQKRDMAFWIFMGISFGGSIVLSIFMGIIGIIPFIGPIITTIFTPILSLALNFALGVFSWRYMYDILNTFGQEKNAMWASIVSVFAPVVFIVFLWIIRKNAPDYGMGCYYTPQTTNEVY